MDGNHFRIIHIPILTALLFFLMPYLQILLRKIPTTPIIQPSVYF